MRLSIIGGTGYVGLVTGIGLASVGNDVICADIDEKKIEGLNNNVLPIHEEGLYDLLLEVKANNKITFTNCIKTAVTESDIIMIAVGTPENKNGDSDLSQIVKALKSVAGYMDTYKVIVIKSTVPVGTCDMAKLFISDNLKDSLVPFDVVSNPEFLREGSAVKDFLNPERVVIGADSQRARSMMEELYKPFNTPLVITDTKSSEMIKYACNTYLATRISFINEIAEICEKVNADITSVIEGMKYDKRIGPHYLNPGPGFGGPCLSKDIKSLISFGSKANANVNMLKAVLNRNEVQIKNIVNYVNEELKEIGCKKAAILGLSFKAGTNDTRNSPALHLIEKLSETKSEISVFDPIVKQIDEPLNSRVKFAENITEAVREADCLIIMTEWSDFKQLDLDSIYSLMNTPVIVDTRNVIDFEKAHELGFKFKGVGLKSSKSKDNSDILKQAQ